MTTACRSACARAALPQPPRVDHLLAPSPTPDWRSAPRSPAPTPCSPKSASPRALLAVLRGELRPALDPRALRALGERLDAADLAILGMLAHGVAEDEVAATLGLDAASCARARRCGDASRLG